MNYRNIISNTVLSLVVISVLYATSIGFRAFAGAGQNISGFGWGGTTSVDTAYQGVGWISFNNTSDGSGSNYGVNVPLTDGDVSGNAWSEHYGWLTFDSANLASCPSAPCKAYRVGNNILGWARFTAVADAGANAGGWTGWVSLSGAGYGVSSAGTNAISGYAWSDELGWIQVSIAPSVNLWFTP